MFVCVCVYVCVCVCVDFCLSVCVRVCSQRPELLCKSKRETNK